LAGWRLPTSILLQRHFPEEISAMNTHLVAKWSNYIVYLLVSISLVIFLTLLLHHGLPNYRKVTNDSRWYLTDAGLDYWDIGVSKPNYRYRTLIGDVARRFPVRVDVGFALVSLSATALYLTLLAGWVDRSGLPTPVAIASWHAILPDCVLCPKSVSSG
jgi:hypothetical protein